jgi:hypothetical protein
VQVGAFGIAESTLIRARINDGLERLGQLTENGLMLSEHGFVILRHRVVERGLLGL